MEQYIDKDAVVAEIERLVNNYDKALDYEAALEDVRNFLDTLEVKEVDLEKYYHKFLQKEWFGNPHVRTVSEMMSFTAKHFFELGLKSKSSYVSTPNIDDTLKEMRIDPDSKEANTFKESYFRVLDKLQAK